MNILVEKLSDAEVLITLNKTGLKELLHYLEGLKETSDHIHLMSKDWGMDDLLTSSKRTDTTICHHLEIILDDGLAN